MTGINVPVPDLAALLADPARVTEVPPAALPALLAQVAAEQSRLAALAVAVVAAQMANGSHAPDPTGDRLLTIDEAAERLGVTRDWLRRRPELAFVVKLSEGVVRYSARGLDHYIEDRAGKGLASDT